MELGPDLILTEPSDRERNCLTDARAQLLGQAFQFAVRRAIDTDARALHADMLAPMHAPTLTVSGRSDQRMVAAVASSRCSMTESTSP